jgi:hypothetical protein
MKLTIDETKRQVIVNAMYSAANTYDECAKTMKEQPGHEFQRLVEQFQKQAAETRVLAEQIEGAKEIVTE